MPDGQAKIAGDEPAKGIAFAVATEFEGRSIGKALGGGPRERQGSPSAQAVICGIGCRDATALRQLAAYSCVASSGFAAALDPAVETGSLLLPRIVLGADGVRHEVHPELHRRAVDALTGSAPIHTDALIQSDTVVRTAAEKSRLFGRSRAAGTDMESASLAAACGAMGLPFVVLRVVLDAAGADLPRAVVPPPDAARAPAIAAIVRDLARHPGDLLPMLALLRSLATARRTLARAVRESLPALRHGEPA